MLNKESTIKAVRLIEELDEKTNKRITTTGDVTIVSPDEDFVYLGDLRDYFMFFAYEATKEEAKEFISWGVSKCLKTKEYEMFFFVIENILSLRYELTMLPMEQISKTAFLTSFEKTKKELKLEDV